ncbi:MAG: hypothetical protein DIZ77_15120 [endosymbiont of Seepiophila jonesi]|uniref:Mor transcription activator domain-containing protein n=1 Tax=endosymbiont of Lamellibrachia luymesi TaxID=2200907 RepID=A0A370D9G0_9GAMM|nr:MAG: hypothetical protein DIZ79_18920 [endosymbiont of Lamellibrachia luymesi]RDH89753.1 MAG: hypothetical protein DIZ77_15120 [endosymbiont of Seepiophila jonesi]
MSDVLVEFIREEIYQEGMRRGLDPKNALDTASVVEARIRQTFGGHEMYIHAMKKGARNQLIFADFSGNNHDQVCLKWGISRRTLQRIVADSYGAR